MTTHKQEPFEGSLGIPPAGLIAVTGYNTPGERTLGLITVSRHGEASGYRVFGYPHELGDIEAAAAALVAQRARSQQ